MLVSRPMGWQAHALGQSRSAGAGEGSEAPLGPADPVGASGPPNSAMAMMAGGSQVSHLPKYGACAGAPNMMPMMGGPKRGREEGEEAEHSRANQRPRTAYWGGAAPPPSSVEPNPSGAGHGAAPYLSLEHAAQASATAPPTPGNLAAGAPGQPPFRPAIMPPGAFPASMLPMVDGSLGWVVKDGGLPIDAARAAAAGGLGNGMPAAGGLEGVPGQPTGSSAAVHGGISYLPYHMHPHGVQPHTYHIIAPPGAPLPGGMPQHNLGAAMHAAGLPPAGHPGQPSIYLYQPSHMLPPRQ